MGINLDKALEGLKNFHTHINEDYLLKVVDDNNGRYIIAVPRDNMSIWDKLLSFIGWSNFNLTAVLKLLDEVAAPALKKEPNEVEILSQACEDLKEKVKNAAPARFEKTQGVFEEIINKIPASPRTGDVTSAAGSKQKKKPTGHVIESGSPINSITTTMTKSIRERAPQIQIQIQIPTTRHPQGASTNETASNPFTVDLDLSYRALSHDQLAALQSSLATKLVLHGEYENKKARENLLALVDIIPNMQNLTEVHALGARFLPYKLYDSLYLITNFSVRTTSDIELISKMSNLKTCYIKFENSGIPSKAALNALREASNLKMLTLDGSIRSGVNVTKCLANLPENCREVKLDNAIVDLTNEQLIARFKDNPLDTLYLYDYDEKSIEKFKNAGIARHIVVQEGFLYYIERFKPQE